MNNEQKERIQNSYINLLIKQYWDKPKARALIKLSTDCATGDFSFAQLFKFYDLDNASGKWLDTIGALFFAFRKDLLYNISEYVSIDIDTLSSQIFFDNLGEINIPLTTQIIFTYTSDFHYRMYIKLIIASKFCDYTISSLIQLYNTVFGNNITIQTAGIVQPMVINLLIAEEYQGFIKLLYDVKLLPLPYGVGIKTLVKKKPTIQYFSYYVFRTNDLLNGNITLTKINNDRMINSNRGYIFPVNIGISNIQYLTLQDLFFL